MILNTTFLTVNRIYQKNICLELSTTVFFQKVDHLGFFLTTFSLNNNINYE